MEVRTLAALPIAEPGDVADARRLIAGLARSLGFDEAQAATAALVATEAATNIIKHAREGEMIVSSVHEPGTPAMALLALDRGPGINDISESMRDGFSTSGSPGTGLGAIMRLASGVQIYSGPGLGTALLMRLGSAAKERVRGSGLNVSGISVPKAGEDVCGDGWSCDRSGSATRILVVDGLGHGLQAAEAARAAIASFEANPGFSPQEAIRDFHAALRATRGAVAAVARIDTAERVLRFTGIGNISAVVAGGEREHNLVSYAGTLGQKLLKFHESVHPWERESVLIVHSDGISRRWDLDRYPGLIAKPPIIIAGVIYRDWKRERDDATIVVVKNARPGQ